MALLLAEWIRTSLVFLRGPLIKESICCLLRRISCVASWGIDHVHGRWAAAARINHDRLWSRPQTAREDSPDWYHACHLTIVIFKGFTSLECDMGNIPWMTCSFSECMWVVCCCMQIFIVYMCTCTITCMWCDVKDNFSIYTRSHNHPLSFILTQQQLTAITHLILVRATLVVEQSLKMVKPVSPGATLTFSSTPASTLNWEEQRTFAATQGDCERSHGASLPRTRGTTVIYLQTALVRFQKYNIY